MSWSFHAPSDSPAAMDLARLWKLVADLEVAVLASSGPVVPHSLPEFEASFDQDLAQPRKDHGGSEAGSKTSS